MSEKLDNPSPPDEKLFDPLSEVTRKERRALMVISLMNIFIIKTESIPSQISALG